MSRVLITLVVLGLVACLPTTTAAQGVSYKAGQVFTVSPMISATCTVGSVYITTTAPAIYVCTAPDVWSPLGFASASAVPPGSMLLIDSGNCPATYTEVATLAGRSVIGTLAASMDVGTTGGTDAITPTGTNSVPTFAGQAGAVGAHTISWPAGVPTFAGSALATHTHTFTGNALGTHAHELPFQLASATVFRQTAAATFGTGTSRAATATQTHTANTTSAAVALSQAITAGTPAGTNTAITAGTPAGTIAWPAGVPTMGTVNFTPTGTVTAPVLTGTQFDNRSAFARVIFCKKD